MLSVPGIVHDDVELGRLIRLVAELVHGVAGVEQRAAVADPVAFAVHHDDQLAPADEQVGQK